MIVDPVLIIGAPRSGTSLLQRMLRCHRGFWSMPSESDLVWDRYCHPSLRDWSSEAMDASDMPPRTAEEIRATFEKYLQPAAFWAPLERTDLLWGFRRLPVIRKMLRGGFERLMPVYTAFAARRPGKRLLEKTASNCFRLGAVNEVFPDAKIIYPTRDGRNNVNSLINAWRHPRRFFTYDVPAQLDIEGYDLDRWKFVLPPGWEAYTQRTLAEVCAFQWRACHEAMLEETAKDKYRGRVLRVKLEDIVESPARTIREIASFVDIPFDAGLEQFARELPVVNSPDNVVGGDKWREQNRELIESILPDIAPIMARLGYSD